MKKTSKRFIALILSTLLVLSQFSVVSFAVEDVSADQTTADEQMVDQGDAGTENTAAFDESATVDGVVVSVKAEEGVFPAGSALSVKKVSVPDALDEGSAASYAFDISILDLDGNELQPDGNAKVSFKTAEVADDSLDMSVYHMNGKEAEELDVTAKGKTATVVTDGFSTYVITFSFNTSYNTKTYEYAMAENETVALRDIANALGITNDMYDRVTSSDPSSLEVSGTNVKLLSANSTNLKLTFTKNPPAAGGAAIHYEVNVNVVDAESSGEVIAPVAKDGLIYNGNYQALVEQGSTTIGTMEYRMNTSGSWKRKVPEAKDAGSYTVYYRVIAGNNERVLKSGEVSAKIEEANAYAPSVAENLVYNGDAQNLITAAGSTNVKNGIVEYAVSTTAAAPTSENDWKTVFTDVKGKDAGNYYVWYRVIKYSDNNYDVVANPASVPVTIDKADNPANVEAVSGLVYNDGKELVKATNVGRNGFRVEYSLDNGRYSTNIPENDNLSAGEHNVAWKAVDPDGNYKTAEGNVTVTIAKDKVVVTVPTGKTLTYNGSDQKLAASGALDSTKYAFSYFVTGVSSEWTDSAEAKDAGEYTVQYKVVGIKTDSQDETFELNNDNVSFVDENGEEVKKSGSFVSTIKPKAVTLSWKNESPYMLTDEAVGPEAKVDGKVEGDTVDPVYDPENLNKKSEPGSYTAKVTGLNNENYVLAPSAVTSADFTVVKKLTATLVVENMTYGDNDTNKYVTVDGKKLSEEDYSIEYSYRKLGAAAWKPWGPNSTTPAGSYEAMAVVTDKSGKTKVEIEEVAKFVIEKKKITVRALDKWINYGETIDVTTDLDYEVTGLTAADEPNADNLFKVNMTVNGSDSQPLATGEYDIVPAVKFNDETNINYEPSYVNGKLYVSKATENKVELTVQDYVYGDTIVKPTATAEYGGNNITIEWIRLEDYNNSDSDSWTEWENIEGQKPKDAGSYIVRATVKGNDSYADGEAMETFTIAKKSAEITIKSGSKSYTGSKVELNPEWVTVTGAVNGETIDYVFTSVPTPIKEVGSYRLTAEFDADGEINKNYSITVNDGTYTINPAGKMTAEVVYKNTDGENDGHCTFDGKRHWIKVTPNLNDGEQATVYYSLTELDSPEGGVTNPQQIAPIHAGKYTIWYYIDSPDYKPLKGSAVLDIDKAYLRVKVEDKEVEYGTLLEYTDIDYDEALKEGYISVKAYEDRAETKELEFIEESVEGLNGFEFDMGRYTDEMSDIGQYKITTNKQLTSDDYNIRYTSGVLTINPKPVTFSWDHENDYEFTYDGKEHGIEAVINKDDLVGTDKREGQVEIVYEDNNKFPNSAVEVKRVTEDDKDWAVGSYTAKVQSLKGERAHNYKIDWENDSDVHFTWKFKIVPVALELTPNDVTKIYGDKLVWNGYTAEKLVNDEKQDDVIIGDPEKYIRFTDADKTKDCDAGSDVGTYKVWFETDRDGEAFNTKSGLHAQNYELSAADGSMDIVQREITLVWSKKNSFEYDGEKHKVEVVSAENDYTENSAIDPAPTYTDPEVNAGEYTAKAVLTDEKDAKNYKIIGDSDTYDWEITKRPATIYANDNTIIYGQDPADKGFFIDKKPLVSNVENGGALDSIGDVSFKFNYSKYGKPGSYKITPVVNNLNPNYYIAGTENGTLTVNYIAKDLLAQAKASGSKAIRLSWSEVTGAAKYEVYASKCNAKKNKYKPKKIATVKGRTYRVTKLKNNKKLKKHREYKFYVVAKDANGKVLAKSKLIHAITGNVYGKYTNAKSISVNKKKVTVSKGSTFTVKTKVKKAKKGKTLLDQGHEKLVRYFSSNKKVAVVSGTGVITGISKGYCKVYVMSVNGIWKEVEVTVN